MSTAENGPTADTTMWTSLLHAGLAGSFLRLPHIPPDAKALTAHGARAAIYGIPWDSTSISRTGANYGPRGIREISSQFLTFNATWDFDLVEALNPVDCGDCDVVLANAGANVRARRGGHQRDAHGRRAARHDRRGPFGDDPRGPGGVEAGERPRPRAHRHPPRHRAGRGWRGAQPLLPDHPRGGCGFDPRKMALLAISGWMNPRTELSYCRERGITVVWLEDIGRRESRPPSIPRSRWRATAPTGSTSASTWTRSMPRTRPGHACPRQEA